MLRSVSMARYCGVKRVVSRVFVMHIKKSDNIQFVIFTCHLGLIVHRRFSYLTSPSRGSDKNL